MFNEPKQICEDIEERTGSLEKYIKSGNINKSFVNNNIIQSNSNNITQTNANINKINTSTNETFNSTGSIENTTTASSKKSKTTISQKKYSSNPAQYWPQIVNDLKQNGKIVLYTNLIGTVAKELNDMTVGIEFPNGMRQCWKSKKI